MRRGSSFAKRALCAALLVGLGGLTGLPAAAADLTVVTYGGVYAESQRKAYGAPWEQRTGGVIEWIDYNGGLAEIRAQVKSGNVLWDVVDVFPNEARIGCDEGLFETLPPGLLEPAPDARPAEEDLVVPRPNDCVAPNILWSWVVFYKVDSFDGPQPRTISDFFDLETFPGERGLSAFPQATLEMALVADGVAPDDVYEVLDTEVGLDRAFAKLDTLGDRVVFWSSGAEPLELAASGAVTMSTAYNGRVSEAILSDGADFRIVWDGQVLEEEWFVVVKGSPNRDAALEFLRIATSPQAQAEQARWIPYGPMRRSALTIIAENEPWFHSGQDVMPHMPDRADVMERTVIADPAWWAENGERISARYEAWMAKR
jgi:putative spermidine/putrescine transport system substrate-binding protein